MDRKQAQDENGVVDAVAIGRNEGSRLVECLASLRRAGVRRIVYVDSGSTDGSILAAEAAGAHVVALDMTRPFTAARARNAGFAALLEQETPPDYVHFIDGDCVLQPDWLPLAQACLRDYPQTVVVCGRRRERHPQASVFNRLCDDEWDTPVGEALACGGDALMRRTALQQVGGYREDLIAGEEPELCLRLRRAGGKIRRLDAEMTLHDAAMTRFSQWWRRTRRAGHAFAEGAALHGESDERHWAAETRRAILWGSALPLLILILFALSPALALLLLLAYPAQILRLAARRGISARASWEAAIFMVLGKFAEAQGILSYWLNRVRGRRGGLIEYKQRLALGPLANRPDGLDRKDRSAFRISRNKTARRGQHPPDPFHRDPAHPDGRALLVSRQKIQSRPDRNKSDPWLSLPATRGKSFLLGCPQRHETKPGATVCDLLQDVVGDL